jgi:hypothetical protein
LIENNFKNAGSQVSASGLEGANWVDFCGEFILETGKQLFGWIDEFG